MILKSNLGRGWEDYGLNPEVWTACNMLLEKIEEATKSCSLGLVCIMAVFAETLWRRRELSTRTKEFQKAYLARFVLPPMGD